MFQLLSHFVSLLIKLLDCYLTRTDISFKLLDFVIKHKLELLKLLSLLLKVDNPLILILNSRVSFSDLALLTLNLLLEIVGAPKLFIEIFVELFNFFLFFVSFIFLLFEVVVYQSQITFRLHSLINDLGKLFLVLIFKDIYLFPCIVFDFFSLLLMVLHHLLYLAFKPVCLRCLPIQLYPLVLFKLLDDLLVMKTKLVQSFLELSGILILLSLQLIESLKISIHFVSIVDSSSLHFNGVGLLHLVDLIFVHSFHFLLSI